jgi:outer membrane protein assembly factor BamB
MWRGAMAISFTQGNSGSSGVHRREGHVVSLNSTGRVRWRSTLPFPGSVKEVVTHGVTISRHVVAVVGEVVRSDSRGSFTVGLSRRTGAVRWRDVRGGRIVDDAQCLESIDSSGRALYVAGIGPAGRGVLERRTSTGEVRWRSRVPRCVTVSALNQGGALWTGIAWQRAGSPIIFGQQRSSGEAVWRQEVSLPTGKWPAEPVFAADDRIAVGTADLISRKTGNSSVYLWYWRWR